MVVILHGSMETEVNSSLMVFRETEAIVLNF